jgi:hypothetical protein
VSRGVGSRQLRSVAPEIRANFPMQANGAEMPRRACCLATEHGFSVCAPAHEAILIEAPTGQIEDAVEELHRRRRVRAVAVVHAVRRRFAGRCRRWNALAAETGRLASLTAYPYLLRSELP